MHRTNPLCGELCSRIAFLICFSYIFSTPAFAQTQPGGSQPVDFTRIFGGEDNDVPVPKLTLPLGRQDASALQVIIDFLKATNGAAWNGMQGSGVLASPGSNEQSPATLTIQNGNAFRLDVDAEQGQRSIRIRGAMGRILESDGKNHVLPLATAHTGLFAFPQLMEPAFPSDRASVLDRGTVSIGGTTLRRSTIERPVFVAQSFTQNAQASVIDLYFDPTTSLLIKSVSSVQLDSNDRERYIQAVSYGDYRKVDTLLLPFSYSQTLNGQRQWSLQLTQIKLNPSVDTSYFQF